MVSILLEIILVLLAIDIVFYLKKINANFNMFAEKRKGISEK